MVNTLAAKARSERRYQNTSHCLRRCVRKGGEREMNSCTVKGCFIMLASVFGCGITAMVIKGFSFKIAIWLVAVLVVMLMIGGLIKWNGN